MVTEKPLGAVSAVVTLLLLLVGIFADALAPFGMNETHLEDALQPPSAEYWLGTDNLGRDLLSRIIFGARISMVVGLAAAAFAAVLATILGILSGYLSGRFDLVVQRFVDVVMSFPGVVFLIVLISIVGPGLWQVIIAMGIRTGILSSRIVRSAVIDIRDNMYVQAARAVGGSTRRILVRHVLPNIMAPIIIIFSLRVPAAILNEASLSFLGFGIPAPAPSWGGHAQRKRPHLHVSGPVDGSLARACVEHCGVQCEYVWRRGQRHSDVDATDLIIVLCKSHSTRAAARSVRHLVDGGAVVVSFQNGLGNEQVIAEELGTDNVLGGVTTMAAVKLAPGRIRDFARAPSTIGEMAGGVSERTVTLSRALTAAGLETHASDDIVRDIWNKLLGNISLSAVSGIANLTAAGALQIPELRATNLRAIDEALAVAAADGIALQRAAVLRGMEAISTPNGTGDNKSSLCVDLVNRRPTEVEFIYGTVIEKAHAVGIATPTLETLRALVKGIESHYVV